MQDIKRILNIELPSRQSAFLEMAERIVGQIRIVLYRKFLHDLWRGKVIR